MPQLAQLVYVHASVMGCAGMTVLAFDGLRIAPPVRGAITPARGLEITRGKRQPVRRWWAMQNLLVGILTHVSLSVSSATLQDARTRLQR